MNFLGMLFGALLGAAIVGVVIAVILLNLEEVLNWFYQQDSLATGNPDLLAITIKKEMEADNVTIVQGVFNKRTEEFVHGRTIKAKQLDAELEAQHRYNKVVQYTVY